MRKDWNPKGKLVQGSEGSGSERRWTAVGSVSWDEARTVVVPMESTRAPQSSAFLRLTAQCHGVAAPPAQGTACGDPAPVLPSKGICMGTDASLAQF